MAEKTVSPASEVDSRPSQEDVRAPERHSSPAVDIFETDSGLVVVADLPGVSSDALDLRIDDDTLTIQARPELDGPGDDVYREYSLKPFFRQFELSDAVDKQRVTAHLQHGVLTLTLPKAQKAVPRRIPVEVG